MASYITYSGTITRLTVETKDKRTLFFAQQSYGDGKLRWGFRYLDEETSETTMTLTMIQLLRDAMASGWTVELKIEGGTDKIFDVKVLK